MAGYWARWWSSARSFWRAYACVNAAGTAMGYYEKTGWHRHVWDASELVDLASDCIQMRKLL